MLPVAGELVLAGHAADPPVDVGGRLAVQRDDRAGGEPVFGTRSRAFL
jgi:hypothetical protein